MKCPHCTISIHEYWKVTPVQTLDAKGNTTGTMWRIQYLNCPECNKPVMRYGHVMPQGHNLPAADPKSWTQFHPVGSTRPPVAKEVPDDVAADYTEAANVLSISPKASAALSRRCLQSILWAAGYAQKDLSKQIDAVLVEIDTTKALPSSTHTIVDVVRNFGNFSAHKITDQTTLQIIDVEPHEAEFCLDVLDALFDHYYIKPAQAQAMKQALNAKLAAANKPLAK